MGFIPIKKLEGFEGMSRSQLLVIAQKVCNNQDSGEEKQTKRIALSNHGAQEMDKTDARGIWKDVAVTVYYKRDPQRLKESRAADLAPRRQPYHQWSFSRSSLPCLNPVCQNQEHFPVLFRVVSLGVGSFLGFSPSFGAHVYISGTSGHNVFNCLGEVCNIWV